MIHWEKQDDKCKWYQQSKPRPPPPALLDGGIEDQEVEGGGQQEKVCNKFKWFNNLDIVMSPNILNPRVVSEAGPLDDQNKKKCESK